MSFSQHWEDDLETLEPSRANQRQARHAKWRPYAGTGPAHQAATASKAPATRPSHHRADHSLSLASSLSVAHCACHCRHSSSAELAHAHHCPILKSTALTALPHSALLFPSSCAHSRSLSKPYFLLRHHGCVLAGVLPWPLLWPCFLTTPCASLFPVLEPPLSHSTQVPRRSHATIRFR